MNYVKNNTSNHLTLAIVFVLFVIIFIAATTANILAQGYLEYQTKEGDSLWTIARQFQLSIQEVAQVNNIEQDQQLSAGQLIKIPKDEEDSSNSSRVVSTVIHTVQRGESLWDIAQQYRLSLEHISSVNDLNKSDSLSIGQEIKILPDSTEKEEAKNEEEQPGLSFKKDNLNYQGMSTSLKQEFRDSAKEVNYTVRADESLWAIAQNYQVSLKDPSQMNDLENSERLSMSQIIRSSPGSRSGNEENEKKESNGKEPQENWLEHNAYITLSPEESYQQDVNKQEKENISEEEYQPVYYTVKKGDTLWSIAQYHSVSMESILAVNNLNSKDVLSVGKKLQIPAIEKTNKDYDKIQTMEYTVAKEDSLWNIAQKFDVKMHEIININQLQNIIQLSVGQKLNIPATDLAAEQETDTTTSIAQTENPKDVIHNVQKGETLWQISRKYQVSVESIASANQIPESRRLIVGQRLVIPNIPNTRSSSISSRSFIWPLNGPITSQFGIRTLRGRRDYHAGIDIDAHTGALIKAAESGIVSFSGYINGYGNVVIIDHAGGYSTVYAHSASNLVKEGQNVTKGDVICKLGSTGNATGSHLHFEIRENGRPVNPLNYLP